MSDARQRSQSACIPPPCDYSPSPRGRHQSIRNHRGGRGGARGSHQQRLAHISDSRNSSSIDGHKVQDSERLKNQPEDRFHRNKDDDYFGRVQDDEEEEDVAPKADDEGNDDQEDDPLDAYMKSLEENHGDSKSRPETSRANSGDKRSPTPDESAQETTETSTSTGKHATSEPSDRKGVRLDIDETDDVEESYYKYLEQTRSKRRSAGPESEDSTDERQNLVEYDNDGNPLSVKRVKRDVEPLPAIDHSSISYEPFDKFFYKEHEDIAKLSQEQSDELRTKLDIKVSGESPPRPVCSFAHFKFDEQLMRVIRRSDYTQPTPIQAQAIPAALSGRNIIGVAMTGSGKTAAYLWPMIVHIMGQPDLKSGDGPVALILVPTRELALQVYGEAKKFASSYKIAVVCAYGGGSKYEQSRDLEAGAEVIVATPGRLIDLIKSEATNLRRVTYLVLDEADRFFEMGFEHQVRSICDQVRPDRQTLLFSATFKKKIEHLARTVTENPVKIVQKNVGEVNEDVSQHVIVLPVGPQKWEWLTSRLIGFTAAGSVLIFVTRIVNSEELHKNLREFGQETLLLHGDMEQSERNRVITLFKRKEKNIMIATDVAARGLDISHIRTVINYDVARDIDTHIHRVGRTGRAGTRGDAYTLITDKDREFAGHLVKNLESANQEVGDDLMKLARTSQVMRKSHGARSTVGGGKHNQRGYHSDQSGQHPTSTSSSRHHTYKHHRNNNNHHHYNDRTNHRSSHLHSHSQDRGSGPTSSQQEQQWDERRSWKQAR